ncbi:hypothetical protein EIN43_22800 [Enterobacter hormaechei]|uniref:Uncharacterized protein n=1 Tax=Enterobacter hormaechei TaxID=158836 RepID=A0A4Y5ZPG6_9ENTR|nr:hypothetical protein EIN43_22800 [Enterobacter hormaechei]
MTGLTFSFAASRSSRSASATRRALPVCEAEISVMAGISTAVGGTPATAPGCWFSIPRNSRRPGRAGWVKIGSRGPEARQLLRVKGKQI